MHDLAISFAGGALLLAVLANAAAAGEEKEWAIHDEARPQPAVVTPGPAPVATVPPPSDAIVLFDGKDLSKWRSSKGGSAARWKVEGGAMEVNSTGGIETEQGFGDCQEQAHHHHGNKHQTNLTSNF